MVLAGCSNSRFLQPSHAATSAVAFVFPHKGTVMPKHKKNLTSAYLGVILIWSTTPLGIVWSAQSVHYTFPLFARMAIGLVVCLL